MNTECQTENENECSQDSTVVRRLLPDTDIVETENGVVLVVNMPGVAGEQVELEVKANQLTLTGCTDESLPRRTVYERAFRLPDRIDRDAIAASMKHGVLQVALPTAASASAQKIRVTTAET